VPPVDGRPAPGHRRRWELSGLTEVLLALPWLWWSWLSIQFIGIPSNTLYYIVLTAWLVSAAAVIHPRTEDLLAWKVYRLRPPSELESRRLGPAWFAVCAAAGVDPNRYKVWVHEGPEATAPVTAGSTIAVTSWALYVLPPRHLEAVLAHELAHHLNLPRLISLWIYWLSLPARWTAKAIVYGLQHHVLSVITKVVLGFLIVGVLIIWVFFGFSSYVAFMLSPIFAPFIVQLAARASEKYADRVALDLGYGVVLAEVFTGREYERAQSWQSAPRQDLKASQPLDSARLRALERLLRSAPESGHQPT
jgi:Zn-dependent protease with chaperone function